jgi:integrase
VRAKTRQRLAAAERSLVLSQAIDGYLAIAPAYKNPKSAETRDRVLRIHFASLHGRDIATITAIDVANILRRLKPQIAIKAHGAVRSVFDYAAARLEPHGVVVANPADPRRLRAVGWTAKPSSESSSHAAVDWRIMPKVISALEDMDDATVACALLIAATAVRAGTARVAKWADFNLEARTWTPPLADLKDGKHHKRPFIVPLNDVALEALERMRAINSSRFVFGRALTDGDITCLIRKLRRRHPDWVDPHNGEPFTVHGLRASFRTWTEDMRRQDSTLAELSLGHKVHGEVSARYVRTGLVEERRGLLEAWGRHLHGETAEVVTFPRSRA